MWIGQVKNGYRTQTFGIALLAILLIYLWSGSALAGVLKRDWLSYSSFNDSVAAFDHTALLAEPGAPRITLSSKWRRVVDTYIQKNREALEGIKGRSAAPFKTIESILDRHGLPLGLKYLAVVESALRPAALSPMGAAGVWQLMPQTAKSLGLTISRHTDERKHLSKSTVAAAKYIQSLYASFGDWLLVIAAYNGGAGTVRAAIRRSGSRNFYALQRFLPPETKAHVHHFIATHYFFEGGGSVVTLTKAEAGRHIQKVSDYLTKRVCEIEQEGAIAGRQMAEVFSAAIESER